jgi:hypothetical protein
MLMRMHRLLSQDLEAEIGPRVSQQGGRKEERLGTIGIRSQHDKMQVKVKY